MKAAGLIGFFLGLVAFMAPAAAAGMTVPLHATESADAPVSETVSLYTRSYALVIGNDAYSGTWPRLSNAVKDAKLVAEALQAKGFEVTLKTNLDYRQLVEAFEKFFLETGEDPDARLLVWYAGHGYSERGEGYLVPVDALDPQEGGRFLRRVLSLRRMGEYVRGANALHVLAIFDSCFSGTIFNVGRAKPPPAITHATTRPVRQFLTSGDAGQTVSDDGTFRKLFIRAINGETRADGNGDGYLAATELGLFMANEITNYTGGRQTPRNGKLNDPDLDQGDFIFKVGPQAPQSPPAVGAAGSGQSVEMLFWQSIQASTVAGDYEAYLDRFPGGTFAPLARSRLAALSPPAASPQPAIPAGTAIRDCPECPELVTIPPGSFRMGDLEGTGRRNESPVHDVRLNVPPAIGRFEVTIGQFDAFVFATGYDTGNQCYVFDGRRWVDQPGKNWRDPGYQQSILDPVTCVSWEDAKAYAAWLTQKTGKTYRLPSEAEWEYAARAGTQARYAFNGGPNDLCAYGNGADRGSVFDWRNNDCSDGFSQRTSPAGKFRANGFGLHDMLGNLWEWVEDCSHDQYGGAPADGSAWVTGGDCGRRMLRGGSWDSRPENLRAAFRVGDRGNARYNFLGFRIARDL